MKTRIRRIQLASTERNIRFSPGLNIIYGPISTGKSQLLRLCRIAFGAKVKGLGPEVRGIRDIQADLEVGDFEFRVYRPLTDTARELICVSWNDHELLLANEAKPYRGQRYSEWLLGVFGLPVINVPSAPTRDESSPTPLSIRDYMMYCSLPKEEIGSQVFSHTHPHKDIKRRYIFELLYGIYSAEIANEQSRLREVRHIRANLEIQLRAIEAVYDDLPWGTEEMIVEELSRLQAELTAVQARKIETREATEQKSGVALLRSLVQHLDHKIGELHGQLGEYEAGARSRALLVKQLKSQVNKLSRAMTATGAFGRIRYKRCPVCGSGIDDSSRTDHLHCQLCLQPASPDEISLREFADEQRRIALQIEETEELSTNSEEEARRLRAKLEVVEAERNELSRQLDDKVSSFISDREQEIVGLAEAGARMRERVSTLESALKFARHRKEKRKRFDNIVEEENSIMESLEDLRSDRGISDTRIRMLEQEMSSILSRMKVPGFLDVRDVWINRTTYLPEVGGRQFEDLLSEGLTVEVNVAHALAHQVVTQKLGLGLPGILFIDGPSAAFGDDGYDPERCKAMYEQIRNVCEDSGVNVQVIVADNRVPTDFSNYIRLELSENDRLIPDIVSG